MADPCSRCRGCGKIADSDSGEPWTDWEDLPPGSDLAVRAGIVKPMPCPECGGSGRAAETSQTTAEDTGWIQTFMGERFFPLAPDVDRIHIEDIAHALSNLCRFTGHTTRFYSVAEHSVHVSRRVPPELALYGLLHDASEAYLMDLARPVKRLPELQPYRDAEARLMAAVCERFGMGPEQPGAVSAADARMCMTEAKQLLPRIHPAWTWSAEPYPDLVLPCWAPGDAEVEFLRRFHELGGEHF